MSNRKGDNRYEWKGFDYAAVFVVGLDLLDQDRWTEEQVNRLTYVAIIRARFRLYIPYLVENKIVEKTCFANEML